MGVLGFCVIMLIGFALLYAFKPEISDKIMNIIYGSIKKVSGWIKNIFWK